MKKLAIFITSFLIILTSFFSYKSNALLEFCPSAKSSILFEANNNTILYEKNSKERLPIASMTKVMTLSLIYDAIKSNKISVDDEVTTSAHAKSMGGSQVYLEEGEKSKVIDLIKCICIASANDAAVTMAEAVFGSEDVFVDEMNKKAESLGMNNTHYMDVTGLTDENHYSTAYDMAVISSYLINTHPEVLEFTSMKEGYFREDTDNKFWLVNTNKLLGRLEGLDGLKTGWTNKAGYCISLTAKQNDLRLITVVMGEESPIVRNNEALELLKYGFSNYQIINLVESKESFGEIKTILYKNDKLKIIAAKEVNLVVQKSEASYYSKSYVINSKNNNLGYVEIKYKDDVILTNDLSYESDGRRNIFEIWIHLIKELFL